MNEHKKTIEKKHASVEQDFMEFFQALFRSKSGQKLMRGSCVQLQCFFYGEDETGLLLGEAEGTWENLTLQVGM